LTASLYVFGSVWMLWEVWSWLFIMMVRIGPKNKKSQFWCFFAIFHLFFDWSSETQKLMSTLQFFNVFNHVWLDPHRK
jgi:hypothetical protein